MTEQTPVVVNGGKKKVELLIQPMVVNNVVFQVTHSLGTNTLGPSHSTALYRMTIEAIVYAIPIFDSQRIKIEQ